MEKHIEGKAWIFGKNIDTDQIYPGIYVEQTELEEIKKHAMAGSSEPNLAKEFTPGDIIITGTNFGCGSSREHAAMTLKAIGVGAVIAESFGRIFFRNAINLGIPAITCKDIGSFAKKGDKLAVDFATGEIKNLTQNTTTKAEPFSEYVFNILQSGGIKPMIRAQLTGK
jgi:3-isopropylmalate/(R)-2-methylmalate dehydratase small subunit